MTATYWPMLPQAMTVARGCAEPASGRRFFEGRIGNVAATGDIAFLKDALVVLGAASIVVPLVHRLTINPVIGFLAAGAALGPNGLGALSTAVPLVDYVTI